MERERAAAEAVRATTAAEEAEASKLAAAAKALASDATSALAKAMPALDSALEALSEMDKSELKELRSYATPPKQVKTVMEAVGFLLGASSYTWAQSRKLLADPKLIQRLREYDKDAASAATQKRISAFCELADFKPATITAVSRPCGSMCAW
eukprot:232628-Pleurochrysis_carterae.AAC.3